MVTIAETSQKVLPVLLPDDLSLWVGRRDLAAWTTESVKAVARALFQGQTKGKLEAFQDMLILLTYCYASGIYATEEIEKGVYKDDIIRSLCFEVYPDKDDVRYFRRQFRDALVASLVAILNLAWPFRDIADEPALSHASEREVMPFPELPEEELQNRFATEAQRRIERAIQADTQAVEE